MAVKVAPAPVVPPRVQRRVVRQRGRLPSGAAGVRQRRRQVDERPQMRRGMHPPPRRLVLQLLLELRLEQLVVPVVVLEALERDRSAAVDAR